MEHKPGMDTLSLRGAIAILLVFYISSSGMFGQAIGLGADGWMAALLGLVIIAPLFLILGRLIRILPGMGLFEMLDYSFGRGVGVLISVLYVVYFIILAANTGLYHGVFVGQVALPNTPLIVILPAVLAVCIYLAKSGSVTMGKWSVLVAVLVIFLTLAVTALAISAMRVNHLLPMGNHSGGALLGGGYRFAALPLGEAVVLLALVGQLDRKTKPYRLFFLAGIFAVAFFVLSFLRDLAILGVGAMESAFYPSYRAMAIPNVGGMGTRMEVFVLLMALLTGVTKVAVCLLAAAKGVRWIFSLRGVKSIVIPVAILVLALSLIGYSNLIALFAFPHAYLRYAPALQMGIPVLMWGIVEIKTKKCPL